MNKLSKSLLYMMLSISMSTFLLFTTGNNIIAWHQDIGISDSQAVELYQTYPNDPEITSWQNGMTEYFNTIKSGCLDFSITRHQAWIDACTSTVSIVKENCDAHPNTLLACKDPRIEQYMYDHVYNEDAQDPEDFDPNVQ
jgi:hypothetical protein